MITGCATYQPQPPVQMQTTFNYEEHRAYSQTGTSTIRGQGFLRQKGGGTVTCAGNEVILVPATSFFREFIRLLRTGKIPATENVDSSYKAIFKQSQCDAQGNFLFDNLPSGNWLVMTEVRWSIGYSQQGGVLMKEISISNNESVQVLLTDKDFIGQ
jgi:hypothetical protein